MQDIIMFQHYLLLLFILYNTTVNTKTTRHIWLSVPVIDLSSHFSILF